MAIYMKVPGVDGSVTAKGYEKQIELSSMSFVVSRPVNMGVGNVANRKAALPDFQDIAISKNMDESSYGCLKEAVMATQGKDIEISIVEPGDTPTEFVKYTLTDTFFSLYSMSGAGGPNMGKEAMQESANLSFSKIEVAFTPADAKGTAGGPQRVIYNLATASK